MNTCNSANLIKLEQLLKRFKLTSKINQKIIQEAQKDYSTCYGLERLAGSLEFKSKVAQKTLK